MGCSTALSKTWKSSRRRPSTNLPEGSLTSTPTLTRSTLTRMGCCAVAEISCRAMDADTLTLDSSKSPISKTRQHRRANISSYSIHSSKCRPLSSFHEALDAAWRWRAKISGLISVIHEGGVLGTGDLSAAEARALDSAFSDSATQRTFTTGQSTLRKS